MNLARFFDPDLIEINLKAKTKIEAIEKLSVIFCKKYPDKNKDEIVQSVIEREERAVLFLFHEPCQSVRAFESGQNSLSPAQ